MTDENRRRNARDEWGLAESSWAAAELLSQNGFHRDAVARYYYAAFHAARAALLTHGEEPRTHLGVSSRFNELFVRDGLMPATSSRALGRLQREREQADDHRDVVFVEADVEEARQGVEEFLEALRAVLTQGGWLES